MLNYSCKISDTKIQVNSNERNKDNEDIQDNEDIALSTKFYRRNKVSREKVHKCPHCDYSTTGPKNGLIAHINAKHTKNEDKPYQFKVDKNLPVKFEKWKTVFMSKLIDICKETKGNVEDCDIVTQKSVQYRQGQDYLTEFSEFCLFSRNFAED